MANFSFSIGFKERTSVKVKAVKYGLMVPCMKDGGKITRPMEQEDLSTLTEMCMMDNGLMIKLMAMALIPSWVGENMLANGFKTSITVTALRYSLMVPAIKETT